AGSGAASVFGIRICVGFRISDFGFEHRSDHSEGEIKNKLFPGLRREKAARRAALARPAEIWYLPPMPTTPDAFAAYHASLIEARYDCVDRLVVNCYFQRGQTGGGFRTFWRAWKGNDAHL